MRKLIAVTFILFSILHCFTLLSGCRCRSELEGVSSYQKNQAEVSKEAPIVRWCRACALRNFLSCKRITGTGSEEEIKKKAKLEACADIGFTPEQCTEDRIRFVECGIETDQAINSRSQ